jgi:hypothetical protein
VIVSLLVRPRRSPLPPGTMPRGHQGSPRTGLFQSGLQLFPPSLDRQERSSMSPRPNGPPCPNGPPLWCESRGARKTDRFRGVVKAARGGVSSPGAQVLVPLHVGPGTSHRPSPLKSFCFESHDDVNGANLSLKPLSGNLHGASSIGSILTQSAVRCATRQWKAAATADAARAGCPRYTQWIGFHSQAAPLLSPSLTASRPRGQNDSPLFETRNEDSTELLPPSAGTWNA